MKKYCRNCHHPLAYKAKFCAHCGQKNSDGRVPLRDLGNQLFFKIFHLESRYFKVLWRLMIPGQVTIDYFNGKHKRYPPPIQFFFVIVFFFLFLLNHQPSRDDSKERVGFSVDANGDQTIQVDTSHTDSIPTQSANQDPGANLYTKLQRNSEVSKIKRTFFSLPPDLQTPKMQYTLDTLLRLTYPDVEFSGPMPAGIADTLNKMDIDLDTSSLNFIGKPIRMATADLFTLTPDELIEKYKITSWYDQLAVKQGIKSLKDPEGLKQQIISALGWTLFSILGVSAMWLSLLYWRGNRYYVEHFIFLLHNFSSMIFMISILLVLNIFWEVPLSIWLALVMGLLLFSVIAMHRYYQQGFFKTFIKWGLFNFFSMLSGVILFLVGILVAFAKF